MSLNVLGKLNLLRRLMGPQFQRRFINDQGSLFEVLMRQRRPGVTQIGDVRPLARLPQGTTAEPSSALLGELQSLTRLGGDVQFQDPALANRVLSQNLPFETALFGRQGPAGLATPSTLSPQARV